MEHTEAIEKMMTERYLLGELLEEDRDAFEEHFFGCTECAAAVRDGAVMLDSGRAAVRSNVVLFPRRFHTLRIAAAAAAAAVLVTAGGYQTLVVGPLAARIRLASEPRIAAFQELQSGKRSEVAVERVGSANDTIGWYFRVIGGSEPHSNYRCDIRDAAGKVRYTKTIDAETARNPLLLTIPPGALPEGEYNLVVSGEPRREGDEPASYPFRIGRS